MAKLNNGNFIESMLETQKSMVDNMVENTRKMANGNTLVNETINKGSEWYNNWLDNQKKVLNASADKAESYGRVAQDNSNKMNEFFQNWANNQAAAAKQIWEMNQNWFSAAGQKAKSFDMSNPMAQFNNWSSQMMNAWNNQNWMNNFQNWTNGFTAQNPFSMDSIKSNADAMTNLFNQYFEMLNYNFAALQKSMQAGTAQDAFKNMMNVNEGFVRFYEMWSPMWQSIQNKTFNMDMFRKMADPAVYKDVMDKMFGFMPEHTAQYFRNFTTLMQEQMKNMGASVNYGQMKGMMQNMMPGFNAQEWMNGALGAYQGMHNNLNSVFAPMAKMITPNEYTKNLADWNEIADKMVVYNIKNAEMQYMIYEKGTKVMEKVAESIANKLENGEEVKSMMGLYQEWLNISDSEFVALFESDDYAKLMAETASLQMKLRKDIEHKVEQSLANIPVATRTEMEEMHKAIYDLKKQVRQLEKMLDMETEVEEAEAVAPAKKTASRKSTAKK